MKPSEFIQRLQSIAQDARHHPEPAVAVSLLAQLLLDLTLELEPIAKKYGALLQASGFLDHLEASANQTAADLQASASSPAEPVAVTGNPIPVDAPVALDAAPVTEIPAETAAA